MKLLVGGLLLAVATAAPLRGQLPGGSVSVGVSLPGGISAEVSVSFESVTNLSLGSLGLTAQLANPLDPTFGGRLPAGTSLASGFPLLLRIEPPAAGGLAFHGVAEVDLHTENLVYLPGTPLRLFAAPLGGAFEDTTSDMGSGSYRVRGTRGGFSEFVVAADSRPVGQVVAAKLARLQQTFAANSAAIPAALRTTLADQLAAVQADVDDGDPAAAVADLDDFLSTVAAHGGTDVPDLWRASRDVVDVAGLLRAQGATLRFSLSLEEALGS
jgi:uncharacterized protein DUF6689